MVSVIPRRIDLCQCDVYKQIEIQFSVTCRRAFIVWEQNKASLLADPSYLCPRAVLQSSGYNGVFHCKGQVFHALRVHAMSWRLMHGHDRSSRQLTERDAWFDVKPRVPYSSFSGLFNEAFSVETVQGRMVG
jgi:hypothetical protein